VPILETSASVRPPPGLLSEAALRRAAERGQRAWPGLTLPLRVFAAHAQRLGVEDQELEGHGHDLWLACACARRDEQALRLLQDQVLPALDGRLRRMGIRPGELDEVRQQLLIGLLTAPNGGLASYAARSSLVSWLRVVASRTALRVRRDCLREPVPDGEALDELVSGSVDPELMAIRDRLRPEFQRALEESVAALSRRAKDVLRMHYIEGMNIDAIGVVYKVHRATVARWIAGIRSAVIARLRERVTASQSPTSSEFRSLTAAIRDDLHLTLDRVLGEEADQAANDGGGG